MSDGSRWRSCVAQSAIPGGEPGGQMTVGSRSACARRHQDGHRALAAAIGDASAASRCDPGNRTSVVCSTVPDPSASATRWRSQRLASFGMVLGNPAAQLLRERSMIRSSGLVRQARRILHLAARACRSWVWLRTAAAPSGELPIWVALNRQPETTHLIEWLIDPCDKPWSGKVHATIVRLD